MDCTPHVTCLHLHELTQPTRTCMRDQAPGIAPSCTCDCMRCASSTVHDALPHVLVMHADVLHGCRCMQVMAWHARTGWGLWQFTQTHGYWRWHSTRQHGLTHSNGEAALSRQHGAQAQTCCTRHMLWAARRDRFATCIMCHARLIRAHCPPPTCDGRMSQAFEFVSPSCAPVCMCPAPAGKNCLI